MKKIIFVHGIGMGGRAERAGFSVALQKLVCADGSLCFEEIIWEDENDSIDEQIGKVVKELIVAPGAPSRQEFGSWGDFLKAWCTHKAILLFQDTVSSAVDLLLDLPLYLGDPQGGRIREKVRKMVDKNPGCVLVGHSLGSLICYDVLCEMRANGELPVTHFITLGSPLQWVKELQRENKMGVPVANLAIPWDNIHYTTDPVCLRKKLDDKSFTGVTNHSLVCEKSKIGLVAHTAYWEDPRVADVIKGILK